MILSIGSHQPECTVNSKFLKAVPLRDSIVNNISENVKSLNFQISSIQERIKIIDKIVKVINTYCKASKALPAIKTNHEDDYIFTIDYAEYNNYYGELPHPMKGWDFLLQLD